MEFWLETIFIAKGVQIAYFRGDPRNLLADMVLAKPTIFITVPRVLGRIHAGVTKNLREKTGVPGLMVSLAVTAKSAAYRRSGRVRSYWDFLVFDKIKEILGGRVHMVATGSAPIAADVLYLFRIAFSVSVQEGYGMTEAVVTNIGSAGDQQPYTVGPPLANIELKLRDVPEKWDTPMQISLAHEAKS